MSAGDVLLRLDETVLQANLAIVTRSIDESTARRARLEAERDGAADVAFPGELMGRAADPVVASLMNGERRLFQTRASAREGQKSQLAERSASSTSRSAASTSRSPPRPGRSP